jgi:hypothetical protein
VPGTGNKDSQPCTVYRVRNSYALSHIEYVICYQKFSGTSRNGTMDQLPKVYLVPGKAVESKNTTYVLYLAVFIPPTVLVNIIDKMTSDGGENNYSTRTNQLDFTSSRTVLFFVRCDNDIMLSTQQHDITRSSTVFCCTKYEGLYCMGRRLFANTVPGTVLIKDPNRPPSRSLMLHLGIKSPLALPHTGNRDHKTTF